MTFSPFEKTTSRALSLSHTTFKINMVSVGSSLFELSGLWFQLFAIFPLAMLSKIGNLFASLFALSLRGIDGLDSFRSMVLDAIERIVNPTTTRASGHRNTNRRGFTLASKTENVGDENGDSSKGTRMFTDPSVLPTRFKHTCNGDVHLQLQKYERHVKFKEEVHYETLLCRPCPNYASVKENYGHAFHGVTKNGHVLQLERPSGWQKLIDAMKARGFESDPTTPVKEHIAFVTTYAFDKVDSRPWPDGKITRIVDVSQFSAGELNFEVLGFLRQMAKFGSAFLCERHGKVYLCKPSSTFRFVYALVAPLASTKTLDNVFILDSVEEMRAKISEEIDLKYVPKEFGGDCECEGGCWFGHPSERALNKFANKLNGIEDDDQKDDDAKIEKGGAEENKKLENGNKST